MNRSIDIGKAITFFAEDEKWLEKLGIGTALVLISTVLSVVLVGIVGFIILAGYSVRLLQNVRDGVAKPLPEWDRWSEDLATGFKLVVAIFIYTLPALIFLIPIGIGALIMNQGSDSAQMVGVPFLIGGYCLIGLYSILLWVMTPGISVAFARDETINSALRFNTIWEWTRARIGPVIIVSLVYLAVSMVLSMLAPLLGVLLCVVGLIVTIPLATLLQSLIAYHLYGQLANEMPEGFTSYEVSQSAPEPPAAMTPSWFEEALREPPATPTAPADAGAMTAPSPSESIVSILPDTPIEGDVTPPELGDTPNRPDDRPNLPQNPT